MTGFIPGPPGHLVMAWLFLKAQDAPSIVSRTVFDARVRKVSQLQGDYLELSRRYNPADIDHSTRVDIGDFAILSAQWQTVLGQPSVDIAIPYNNMVDSNDLTALVENWPIEN